MARASLGLLPSCYERARIAPENCAREFRQLIAPANGTALRRLPEPHFSTGVRLGGERGD